MAKTRKKIARIHFDDLDLGMPVQVMYSTGDMVTTDQGLFVRFTKIDDEWFLVLRPLKQIDVTPPGARRRRYEWRDMGPIEISTRAKLEVWHWER